MGKNLQSTFGYQTTFEELVPLFNIEKTLGFRFLFDSLIKFKLQKKHDDWKHNETEIDDDDSQQLSLILKSFIRIRENENFVVKADFEKNEIRFEYYYNDIDDSSSEKEINYLNKFLKVAKFKAVCFWAPWDTHPRIPFFSTKT